MTRRASTTLVRKLTRGALIGPLIFLVALAGAPAPALASCLPLDLGSVQRTEETAIFAGTVTVVQANHVFMHVDAWFVGADPVEDAEIVGGSDPTVITSADWTPAVGDRYLVVAEREAPNGFVTSACQQTPVGAGVIEGAAAVLGPPQAPPFETPGPAPTDGGASPTSAAIDTAPWLVVLGVAVLSALLALLARRQRGRRSSST